METTPARSLPEPGTFGELRRLVKQARLLEKQPAYYAYGITLSVILLAPAVAVLVLVDDLLIQLLTAVYSALVFHQMVFIGHDAAHRQIFRKASHNDYVALSFMPLVGVSFSWWFENHNQHHSTANEDGVDPAINFSIFAFSEAQALAKRGFERFMVRYQALHFVPLSMLYPLQLRINSMKYLLRGKARYSVLEPVLFAWLFRNLCG